MSSRRGRALGVLARKALQDAASCARDLHALDARELAAFERMERLDTILSGAPAQGGASVPKGGLASASILASALVEDRAAARAALAENHAARQETLARLASATLRKQVFEARRADELARDRSGRSDAEEERLPKRGR